MIIKEFVNDTEVSPFAKWFNQLNPQAAAKLTTALYRLEQGHASNIKALGDGVYEYKIHFGPGYRIYFGKEGDNIIILLAGGTKKRQSNDIALAKTYWKSYRCDKSKR